MRNLFGLTRSDLEEYFLSIGEKKFRALQVYEWLYQKKVWDIDLFSNIKKEIREKLKNDFTLDFIKNFPFLYNLFFRYNLFRLN